MGCDHPADAWARRACCSIGSSSEQNPQYMPPLQMNFGVAVRCAHFLGAAGVLHM